MNGYERPMLIASYSIAALRLEAAVCFEYWEYHHH